MSAIDNVPLTYLLNFAESYASLGTSVQRQLDNVVNFGSEADANENAIRMVLQNLRPLPAEIKTICEEFLESKGSGGRYASSDAALRGRLVRLAHTRPDLRADILPLLTDKAASRPLHQIAREIRSDWKPVNFAAKPYLEAMMDMSTIDDQYGADDGHMIVRYFLSNAKTWKGDVAKRVKAELNQMLKGSKVACGWDGGESDTMGCGEGTVMAMHEKGKSVDPTKDMSPEDAAEWKKQNIINKDQFTKGASARRR